VLLVENNMEASMNRAHADGLHEIALALARYLTNECRVDPNPSGVSRAHASHVHAKVIHPELSTEDDGQTPALVADLRYSVQDAVKITGKAEVTIRKWMSSRRLPFAKEGNRVVLLGKDLARVMATQLSAPADTDAPEA
jgi:hypothetical protein